MKKKKKLAFACGIHFQSEAKLKLRIQHFVENGTCPTGIWFVLR